MENHFWESSRLVRLFSWIFSVCSAWWNGSLLKKTLNRIGKSCSNMLLGSFIFQWRYRNGIVAGSFENSGCMKVLDSLLNGIPQFFGNLIRKKTHVFSKSLTVRFIDFLVERIHILAGLFIAFLLIIPHSYWKNMYSTIAVLGLFTLLLIRAGKKNGIGVKTRSLDAYFLFYLICIVLAFVFSVYFSLSIRFMIFYLTNFGLMLVILSSVRTIDELVTLVELVLCGISLSGVYGVWQSIVGVPVNAAEIDITLNDSTTGRIFSFFDNPNNFAEILIMLLPFFLTMILSTKNWKKRIFYIILFLPPLFSLISTLSRSSWIGFALALIIVAMFINWRIIPVMAILGLVALPFMPMSIKQRIASIFNPADTSMSYRGLIFKTMWPVIKDYWWTGLGLGNDAVMQISQNYPIYSVKVPLHCHNVFLQTWVETGILGLLSFCSFIIHSCKRALWVLFKPMESVYLKYLVVAGIASISGILLTSMVEYVWFYPRTMLIFWCVMGILLAALSLAEQPVNKSEQPEPQVKTDEKQFSEVKSEA